MYKFGFSNMKSEYALQQTLSPNFFKCVSPLFYAQMFCGSNRLDYQGNTAVPATKGQSIYTVLVCCCTFLSHLAYVINWYQLYYGNNNLLFATGVFCMLFQFITYSFTIARIRLVKQKDNLNLFSLFYKIDRSLALGSDQNINKYQFNLNFVLVLGVIILLISGCLVNVYNCIPKYPIFSVLITIAMLTNYLEIVCIGNYVYYLAIRLRILNFKIQSRVKATKKVSTHPPNGLLAVTGLQICNETCIEHHEIRNFTVCLRNILVAYSTISKIFGFQLFTIISSFFVMSFVIFELILEGFRHNTYPSAGVITSSLVVWFFFMQIWVLGLFCNLLISEFRILKDYSVRMQRKIVRGPVRRFFKQTLSYIEWEKPMFSICGMFNFDLSTPLVILSIIANYFIIFVQLFIYRI